MKKIKLALPEEGAVSLPELGGLKLNLNSRKSKGKSNGRRGINLYKRQLNQIRRSLR